MSVAPAIPAPPAVTVSDAVVRHGENTALAGVSLTARQGRICAVLGENGAGKSTLLRAVLGLDELTAGTIEVLGEPSDRARARRRIAYVPQDRGVDLRFPMTVHELALQGRHGRRGPLRGPDVTDRAAAGAAVARVGLSDLAQRPLAALSGGQRRRAFLARAIAQEAPVLLLDEPFTGLDAAARAAIVQLLRELASNGACVVLSTHDLVTLPALADDVVRLASGLVVSRELSEGAAA